MNESEIRTYVEHLRREHSHFDTMLLKIGHEVAALSHIGQPRGALTRLTQQLAELRQQLQLHFSEEETGGCLEEAVVHCPSLGDEGKTIVAEHPVLDRMLEQLVRQTHDPAASPADVQRSYQAFAEKLRAHEAAENRLLQLAFGAEAADYDTGGVE
jgi:hypothetical protein